MAQTYDGIMAKLKEARAENDVKKYKLWHRKLEKWQLAYGAYAPIGKTYNSAD